MGCKVREKILAGNTTAICNFQKEDKSVRNVTLFLQIDILVVFYNIRSNDYLYGTDKKAASKKETA